MVARREAKSVTFEGMELGMLRWAVSIGQDELQLKGTMTPEEDRALETARRKLLRAARGAVVEEGAHDTGG